MPEDRNANNTDEVHSIRIYSTATSPNYATRNPGTIKTVASCQSNRHLVDGLCVFNLFDIGNLIPR